MIAFDINHFNKMIESDKFELGKEYAVTFDPDYVLDSYEGFRRAFILTNGTDKIMANDTSFFSNAIDTNDVAVCKVTFKQIYTEVCSIVYFKFIPLRMFLNGTFQNRIFENDIIDDDILIKHRIFTDTVDTFVHGVCDKYILTDDVYNITSINVTIIEPEPEPDSESDTDNTDDSKANEPNTTTSDGDNANSKDSTNATK